MEEDPDAPVVNVAAEAALMPVQSGDLDPTIDVQITQEIIDKAGELGSVEAIYEFVRNECSFQAYYGSQKGSVETLRQRSGNDYDLASLLIALLRASGVPARYAVGMIEMPVDRANSWLAVDDGWVAGSILYTTGLEGLIVMSGPDVVAVRVRRVWVEAYGPRGYGSPTWVPLDPAFALSTVHEGVDIPEEMGLDAQSFVDEYYDPTDPGVTLPRPETVLELMLQDVTDYLDVNHPDLTLGDVVRTHEITPEKLGILPGSLPYTVRSRDLVFSEIPADRRYQIRFHLHDGGTDLIDHTLNLPEIAGKRITIDYVGATPADEAIIEGCGGIYQTPPALVDLKPVLRVEGEDVAVAAIGVGMGVQHESDVYFLAPDNGLDPPMPQNVVPVNYNVIVGGAAQAIGLAIEGVSEGLLNPPPQDDTEGTASLLYDTAMDYLGTCRNADRWLAHLMHAYVTTGVAVAIVENVVTVTANGFDWEGLRLDADRSVLGFWPVDRYAPSDPESKDFMIIAGAEGSLYASRIYEDGYGQDAVSTMKILEVSVDAGIPVYKRWSTLPLPANTQPADVQQAIEDAIYYHGHVVTFPADPITVGTPETGQWTGTGWIDMDPDTGAAGYFISGSNAGGATYEYWPPAFIDLAEGDRSVVLVEIDILTPEGDSPDPNAVTARDTFVCLGFQYEIRVTYDDSSTATLGPYWRRLRKSPRDFVPGNYTFTVWIARRAWYFNLTIAKEERELSFVGVLIREDNGTEVGKDPPKFLPVAPTAGNPPSVDVKASVIPSHASSGGPLAGAYEWSGGSKLLFMTPSQQITKIQPGSGDPSSQMDDQDVDVVVILPGGEETNGYARFNFAPFPPPFSPGWETIDWHDQRHKMTVYKVDVMAEDGISDPPGFVPVRESGKLKATVEPADVPGRFEHWTTTSSKVTLAHLSPGPLGLDVVEVVAGDGPSDAVDDEEIVPNFRPEGTSRADAHEPHQMSVIKLQVTHIKFNHSAGDSADGIDIRKNATTDITVPEWLHGGQNKAAAYIKGIALTIEARFTVLPGAITSATLFATTSDTILGSLAEQTIIFSDGVSTPEYIAFTPASSTPDAVGKGTVEWQWKAKDIGGNATVAFEINSSGPHVIYTVLASPNVPMDEPWTQALDIACDVAAGCYIPQAAVRAIWDDFYYSAGGVYDTIMGASRYTDGGTDHEFKLTKWLVNYPVVGTVNCYDMGKSVVTFANALGCETSYSFVNGFGYLNCIKPIGCGWTNNPFYDSGPPTDPNPIVDGDWDYWQGRSGFANHGFARHLERIYDASLGQVDVDSDPDYGPPHTAHDLDGHDTWTNSYRERVIDDNPASNPADPADYAFTVE